MSGWRILAGIAVVVGVFFLLFKDFIRRRIFSVLAPVHTYGAIRLFMVLVTIVTLTGIVFLFLSERSASSGGVYVDCPPHTIALLDEVRVPNNTVKSVSVGHHVVKCIRHDDEFDSFEKYVPGDCTVTLGPGRSQCADPPHADGGVDASLVDARTALADAPEDASRVDARGGGDAGRRDAGAIDAPIRDAPVPDAQPPPDAAVAHPPEFEKFDAASEFRVFEDPKVPQGTLSIVVSNRHAHDRVVFEIWRDDHGSTAALTVEPHDSKESTVILSSIERLVWVGHATRILNRPLAGPFGYRVEFQRNW